MGFFGISGGKTASHDGDISGREFKSARHELIDAFGRTKGERIVQILELSMDRDLGKNFNGISRSEVDAVLKSFRDNPHDGIDRRDVEKLEDILNKYL
ncbi:MAG: hypothetical protein HYV45_03015 [Candidatus Moranbacteria bacterium]|nr:hypothetical protein [Candidatus Moranbacteria bacterium]